MCFEHSWWYKGFTNECPHEWLLHQSRVRMISKYWWHCCLTLIAMKCQACRFLKDMKLIWYEHIWTVIRFGTCYGRGTPTDSMWILFSLNPWIDYPSLQIRSSCRSTWRHPVVLQQNRMFPELHEPIMNQTIVCFILIVWQIDTRNLFSRSICQLWSIMNQLPSRT